MKAIIPLLILYMLAAGARAQSRPKHVIIINADDLGYNDLSSYGATTLSTPHLDLLAEDGIRFTDAHAAASFCSPSRYGLLMGRYAYRTDNERFHLGLFLPGSSACPMDPERYTLGDVFKDAGFKTALIGKWHLGDGTESGSGKYEQPGYDYSPGPLDFGFDYFYGVIADRHFAPYAMIDGRSIELDGNGQRKATNGIDFDKVNDYLLEKSLDYIEQNRDSSFFLYLNSMNVHLPATPAERYKGTSNCGYYGDFVQELDGMAGEVKQALFNHGILEQTLLIFTSDNGGDNVPGNSNSYFNNYPEYYNAQGIPESEFVHISPDHWPNGVLRLWKGRVNEAGHRIPMIVHWPEAVTPGQTSDILMSHLDFMATFAAMFDITIPEGMAEDSENTLGNLLGTEETQIRQSVIHWSLNKDGYAARAGDWKLQIDGGNVRLFNLRDDLTEDNNLAASNPDKVEELSYILEAYGFETPIDQFVMVSSPNGGEELEVGSEVDITWIATGSNGSLTLDAEVGDVRLEYTADGNTWKQIAASTENDGSHTWTVPDEVSASVKLRVSETGGALSDESDAVFAIVPAVGIPYSLDGRHTFSINGQGVRYASEYPILNVVVYNARGTLMEEISSPGQNIIWNGLENLNKAVPNGLYIVSIRHPHMQQTLKILVED